MRRAFQSLSFDGSAEYAKGVSSASFNWEYTQAWTFACWFKTTGSSIAYFFSKIDSSPRGFGIGIQAAGNVFAVVMNTGTLKAQIDTTATYNDGNWHFVCATYTGSGLASGLTIFIDGDLVASSATVDALGAGTILNTQNFNVGGRTNGSELFSGNMAHVSIWSTVLMNSQIWEAYNLGNPRDLLEHSASVQGYWRLGENGVWPYVIDEGISRANIELVNMDSVNLSTNVPRGESRNSSKSLVFGGTDEYVTMGNVLSFDFSDTFSISCWFKTTSSSDEFILSKRTATFQGYDLYIFGGGGSVRFECLQDGSNNISVDTQSGLNDGSWHHLVATYDGTASSSGMTLYVDGVVVTTNAADNGTPSAMTNTDSFNFGTRTDGGSNFYTGALDEVVVYDVELAASDVSDLYNNGWGVLATEVSSFPGCVGYWRCGDYDTNPTITDKASSSGNDGTMINMEAVDIQGDVPSGPGSLSEESLYFDGSTEYVTMGDVLGYDRLDSFSLSVWIKTTGASEFLIGKQNGGSPYTGYGLSLNASGLVLFEMTNTTSTNWIQVVTTLSVNDDQWYHLCVTYDGSSSASGVTIYINGEVASITTLNDSLTASIATTNEFRIGSRDSGVYAVGNIDESSIYNIELSAAQVGDIYNGGDPTNLLGLTSASGLTGWWKMGDGDVPGTVQDNSLSGNDGTMTNMDLTNVRTEVPKATFGGSVLGERSMFTGEVFLSQSGALLGLGADDFPVAPRMYFRMRGWNTVLLDWEVWTSADVPDLTPPVGPCVNIQIQVMWD